MTEKKLYYGDYLQLPQILNSQFPKSEEAGQPVHDETLFIITHQVYELWFKQILYELDSIIQMFEGEFVSESSIGTVVARMNRIIEIQKLLVDQIRVLETMSPMDFLEFRDLLSPSSGFQSVQFRLIENKLGLEKNKRVKIGKQSYTEHLSKADQNIAKKSESSASLFELVEQWLERTPFLQFAGFDFWESYHSAINTMLKQDIEKIKMQPTFSEEAKKESLKEYENIRKTYAALFNPEAYEKLLEKGHRNLSQKATLGALFILLYREEPILQMPYTFLTQLVDADQQLNSWRYRHTLMVFRMIGVKIGTGGSSGHGYLKKTSERHQIFRDLANLSTYIIPRSSLPELPQELKKGLGFYYTHGSK